MGTPRRSGVVADSHQRIVAGGRRRIISDEIDRIRREVRERYAEELSEAGLLRRLRLRLRIRKKMQTRIDKVAPSRGLYAKR